MRKYRKKLIGIWIGIAVSAATVFVPVTASGTESGEEKLYEDESLIEGEVIESGALVEPGVPATTQTTPEQTTPEQTTPEQTKPEQTTPEQTKPEQTTPEQTTPIQTTPEQTTPIQTTPEQTTPIQTTPEQTKPEQTTPVQTTPEQTTPEQTTPVQTTPEQTTPVQTTPEQTTEEDPITVSLFNGKTLEIERDINESEVPDEFDIVTYSYKGKEIEIAESKSGLILFYLKDDGETANFYVYNEGKDSCIPFVKINSSSDEYIFLDLEEGSELLEGLESTKISVNGKTLPSWKPAEGETAKEDYIVYLINQENVRSLYHVNIATGVIESYYGQSLDPADAESGESGSSEIIGGDSVLQEDTSDRDELLRKIAIFGGGAVGIAVLVIAGILLYRYLKKKMDQPEDEEDELYDDELYEDGEDDYEDDEDDEEELDPDEAIERELAALEQEEWNKVSQEEENSTEEFQESGEDSDTQEEIDMDSLNKTFNDLASKKEADLQPDMETESSKDEEKPLKRNLKQVLEDDDDFEVTDFRD